jgi:hypothetical protein
MARITAAVSALLLCIVPLAYSSSKDVVLCNSDGSKCEDFASSVDLEALAIVSEWWGELSAKGKVKCQAEENKRKKEEALNPNTPPVFRSVGFPI